MSKGISLDARESARFLLVDALRGFAALIVVLFHVWHKNISLVLDIELPSLFEQVIRLGNMGVPIFFVLSGFVIAHSVYGRQISPSYFARFIVRRSLRLDPAYWASIALALATLALSGLILRRPGVELPSVTDIAVHLVYLQEILGVPEIVGVYWTLCYEVQFYLVFVALLGLVQYLSGKREDAKIGSLGAVIFIALWCVSLLMAGGYLECPRGLFLDRWFQFFAGTAAYWAYRGYIPTWTLLAVLVGTLGFTPNVDSVQVTVILTAALLFSTARSGHIFSVSCGRVVQMLGAISYSLYLTHMLVGCRVARFAVELYPQMGLASAVALMTLSTLVSIAFALVFYWAIERPSMVWSRSIPLVSRKGQLASAPTVVGLARGESSEALAPQLAPGHIAANVSPISPTT